MEVSRLPSPPPPPPIFTPYSILIKVTTKEEAKALYAIFNHWDNTRLLTNGDSDAIRKAIGKDHYVTDCDEVIAQGVTYKQFYYRETTS